MKSYIRLINNKNAAAKLATPKLTITAKETI